MILLDSPDDVRYGLAIDIVYFAEDMQAAAVMYRLAIENESPDLFIAAGEEFLAVQAAATNVASAISMYCGSR